MTQPVPGQRDRDLQKQMEAEQAQVRRRMATVKHKILVLSGKGGVGKSTVAVNLAVSLAFAGKPTGLLDIDVHGPSVPKILSLEGEAVVPGQDGMLLVRMGENLKVMSIGFLLPSGNDAVIWRGPRKYHAIRQFLKDVEWGDLNFLIVDSPPGTGDEPPAIAQLLENADGAIVVTTPQDVTLSDVRRGITFCRNVNLPVLGVIENMSGFICPKCGERTDIFRSGGGQRMAQEMEVPFLGPIPIDPQIVEACDSGRPCLQHFAGSATARGFAESILPVMNLT